MAEPVGTAAAVLQLAGIAAKASLQLYEFFSTIKNAPQEILGIGRDIKNFHRLVCNLQGALGSPDIQTVVDRDNEISRALKDLQDPMDNCRQACDRVMLKLSPHLQESKDEEKDKETGTKRRLRSDIMWFFRRREVLALINDLERTKTMFSDAMGSLTLLLTFRTSAAMTIPKRKFDDDAGSAIIQFATAERKQPTLPSQNTNRSSGSRYTAELLEAVRRRSISIVSTILELVDVNARDPLEGRTALSIAAELGDVDMATLLLDRGAAVNIRQYSLSTRFMDGMHPIMVSGRFPLHWAAVNRRSAMVELLLQHGANPNARSSTGRPVLQEACMSNDQKSVRLLLENGADVNARSYNHGWTALHEAASWGYIEIIQILFEYKPLLDIPATHEVDGATPLYLAMRDRNLDVLTILLSQGADPNIPMVEDITPLHLAATSGWVQGINVLLDHGALIDARDALLRETPLHKAARNIETMAIKVLCARGADTELKNIDGLEYQAVLECATRYPAEWQVGDKLGSYCTFY